MTPTNILASMIELYYLLLGTKDETNTVQNIDDIKQRMNKLLKEFVIANVLERVVKAGFQVYRFRFPFGSAEVSDHDEKLIAKLYALGFTIAYNNKTVEIHFGKCSCDIDVETEKNMIGFTAPKDLRTFICSVLTDEKQFDVWHKRPARKTKKHNYSKHCACESCSLKKQTPSRKLVSSKEEFVNALESPTQYKTALQNASIALRSDYDCVMMSVVRCLGSFQFCLVSNPEEYNTILQFVIEKSIETKNATMFFHLTLEEKIKYFPIFIKIDPPTIFKLMGRDKTKYFECVNNAIKEDSQIVEIAFKHVITYGLYREPYYNAFLQSAKLGIAKLIEERDMTYKDAIRLYFENDFRLLLSYR